MADISNSEPVEYMLTTIDNPFDPFSEWDEWLAWDLFHGYNTLGFLARITVTSDELSEPDQLVAIQLAIQEIVDDNVSGLYRKVVAGQVPAAKQ
jgi:hypothetical protein